MVFEESETIEPATKFKEVGRQFIIVFKKKVEENTIEKVIDTTQKTREKAISLIKMNLNITTEELAEKTNISIKGIEYLISKLKKIL